MIISSITGFFSGIISGMGIGGGTILIPALMFFSGVNQRIAQGVNLLYFIPTALAALFIHFKNKKVDLMTGFTLIVPGVIGAVIGAYMTGVIPVDFLRKIYAVYLFAFGIYEVLKKDKKHNCSR